MSLRSIFKSLKKVKKTGLNFSRSTPTFLTTRFGCAETPSARTQHRQAASLQSAVESRQSETATTLKASDNQRELVNFATPLPRPPGCRAFPASPPAGPAEPSSYLSKRRSERAWEGRGCRAGTKGPGRVTDRQTSPTNITFHRRGASKMEGKVPDLKAAAPLPQLAGLGRARFKPRQPRPGPTRRRGGRGGGTRPGAPRPQPHAAPTPRASPPPPGRPPHREPGGEGSAHLRRVPAGTQTSPRDSPSC